MYYALYSKLGAHVTTGPRNGYGEFCQASPAVITAVNEGGALLEVKQHSPNTVTIFRDTTVYLEAPHGINGGGETHARNLADQYFPELLQKWQQNQADYYTISNEQGGNDLQSYKNIIAFERRIVELGEQYKLKFCLLNLAGGSPGDFSMWTSIIKPFIEEMALNGHIYGRHAYGSDLAPPDGNSGRPFTELGVLAPHVKMVITEAGLDGGFGYRGDVEFYNQAVDYDELCQNYDNLIGFCLWNLGNWQASNANFQTCLPELTEYLHDFSPPIPPTPPPSTGGNILYNSGFECGWYHPNGIPELQIPNDWQFHWKEGDNSLNPSAPWTRPEVRVLPSNQLPSNPISWDDRYNKISEQELFILDGDHTVKIFKGYGAIDFSLTQTIEVDPFEFYNLRLNVFPDSVVGYDDRGQKIWADDIPAELRIIVNDEPLEWFELIAGEWNFIERTILSSTNELKLAIEIRGRWALKNNGFFMDKWGLVKVESSNDCEPREPYNREYWVLAQDTTESRALEIMKKAYQDSRQTVGFSYDDAGIGCGLTSKKAVLWDIGGNNQGKFIDFYKKYYPDVEVEFRW